MILEHALLTVKPGQASAFEDAMSKAAPLIAASPGFLGLEVRPSIEAPGTYLLLVRWESLTEHDPGSAAPIATSTGRRCCTTSTIRFRP